MAFWRGSGGDAFFSEFTGFGGTSGGSCLLKAFDKGLRRLLDVEVAGGGMEGGRGWWR